MVLSCLPKEKINFEQLQKQSPTKTEIILESTNNGLETRSENTDISNDSSSGSTCAVKTAESSSPIKTDPVKRCSCAEKQSEDKDALARVSEGESSNSEPKGSVTPKTPHSEKIVAAVVNPYLQSDSTNESDETLSISVEDNIPKYVV